ncbi:MAG: MlaD family protein [Thermoleophilaceae bacterium]
MVKETPSLLRLGAMVFFTLSCIGILMFLWLAFGGPLPLKAESYRFKVAFKEAATLTQEADVRIAGVNVGKVKTKELDKAGNATVVELELKEAYAPIPRDTRAILRQKTLLGETYVELSTGDRSGPMLPDGGRLADVFVQPTVELDEIFNAFDKPTRTAFQGWVKELAKAAKGGRGEDLNDAFGNLEPFAVDGAQLLSKLDEQDVAVRRLIKNTGVVFGALNKREGALRDVIVNSNEAFEATASRDDALAETFRVFPTFLGRVAFDVGSVGAFFERHASVGEYFEGAGYGSGSDGPRSWGFGPGSGGVVPGSRSVDPGVEDGPPRSGALSGRGRAGVRVRPTRSSPSSTPSSPCSAFTRPPWPGFISNGGLEPRPATLAPGNRVQAQIGQINNNSFERFPTRPERERGNAYLAPERPATAAFAQGPFVESFDCRPSGGEQPDPDDAGQRPQPAHQERRQEPTVPRAAQVAVRAASSSTAPTVGRHPRWTPRGNLEGSAAGPQAVAARRGREG